MLQDSVSQTLTDINDGVVILKRVSDPKNGMSPSLGKKRSLTPITITSDSSEEEMNLIGETPRVKFQDKIMRKKFEAFTRKIKRAEFKQKLPPMEKPSKVKYSQSLPPWMIDSSKRPSELITKANKVSIYHSKTKKGGETPFFTNDSMGSR